MLIDMVDDQDRVVGQVRRDDVFRLRANFRVAHAFVFNRRGELLLQQIAPGKRHAGRWGSSMAGYVHSGEGYSEAAHRRLKEELGIIAQVEQAKYLSMEDSGCRKFITLFTVQYEGPLAPAPAEVSSIELRSPSEVSELLFQEESRFTPTFAFIFEQFFFPIGRVASR